MKKPTEVSKIEMKSGDVAQTEVERLSAIFPQFVKDGVVDFDAFREFFGEEGALAEAGQERYGLSWKGKSDAFKAIRVPATGTLTPQEEESKNWDTTENVFIEGDNLEALKLLQRHYRGKIKMIYIDPPYNTGKDFIYKDNFTENKSDYYERTGQTEGGVALTSNPASAGRYHSDWLTMMYPRLFLARQLLRDDGVIFISIDDNEVANLRLIMDEIFGEENFYVSIIWKKRGGAPNDQTIGYTHEYIICYAKDINSAKLYRKERTDEQLSRYSNPDNHPKGRWASDNLMANIKGGRFVKSLYFAIVNPNTGEEHFPSSGGNWRFNQQKIQALLKNEEIYFGEDGKGRPKLKRFLDDVREGVPFPTIWDDVGFTVNATRESQDLFDNNPNIFDMPKPTTLLQDLLRLSTKEDDIVIDFFAGSGTTAHAVMAQNAEDGGSRKWISVQIPEGTESGSEPYKAGYKTIAEISRERIRRAGDKIGQGDIGFKSYRLSQSNYRQWQTLGEDTTEEELKEQMKMFIDQPLADGYSEKDVVYEIAVKEGFSLNCHITPADITKKLQAWSIVDGSRKLVVILNKQLIEEDVAHLGLTKEAGDILVCLDSALTDSIKLNLSRNFNLKVI